MTHLYHEWDSDVLIRPEWPLEYRAIHKIDEFGQLPNGWHCGEGVPLDSAVADFANGLLTVLSFKGISNIDVFPRPNGGIEFHVYGASGHLELFIDSNSTFDYLKNDADDNIVEDDEDVPWESAIPLILKSFRADPILSGQCQPSPDTSPRRDDSLLTRLPPRLTAQVYPSSMNPVPLIITAASVHTFRNTMHVRSGTLQLTC
jgi:hypothetical protein